MSLPAPAETPAAWAGLRTAALLLLALKAGALLADPQLRLFLPDSAVYLQSALGGPPPLDRSWTYPWLVRAAGIAFGSGLGLVAAQTLLGCLSALLLHGVLVRHAGVRPALALAAAVLLALEPAQLFYERMLMAEAAGAALLACALASHAEYLARGRLGWLAGGALLGLAAASCRLNLLPAVLAWSALVPLLRGAATRDWRTGALHLALALALTGALHAGYRQLYAGLTHGAPGYHGASGRFQLALVVPLVEPRHLAAAGLPPALLEEVALDRRDPRQREAHLWRQGGLIEVVSRHSATPDEAAGRIARAALRDHPVAFLGLAGATLRDHFDRALMRERLEDDLGRRAVNERLRGELQRRLGVDAAEPQRRRGLVRAWFASAAAWLPWTLPGLPLLALAAAWAGRTLPGRATRWLIGLSSLGLVAGHLLFSHIVSYRYLQPLPWFVLANLALLAEAMLRRRAARGAQPASSGARSRR